MSDLSEAEMVREIGLRNPWHAFIGEPDACHVAYEQSFCGSSIADVLVSGVDAGVLRRRNTSGLNHPIRDEFSLAVLHAMPSNVPISLRRIRERLGWGEVDRLADQLARLCEHGFVHHERTDVYRKAKQLKSVVNCCVALEAKLSDWRSGIVQAVRYRLFANEVYVLLPVEMASTASQHAERFRETGVGLALWDGESLHLAVRGTKRPPVSPVANALSTESVFADILQGVYHNMPVVDSAQ